MVVLLLLLLLRLFVRGRRSVTARTGVCRRRGGGRSGTRQVELRQRRHELLVLAVLLRAGAAHVEHDVFVRVHLEEVSALVREMARVAALLARRPYGVRWLVGEPGHHFAKRALHGWAVVHRRRNRSSCKGSLLSRRTHLVATVPLGSTAEP